MDASSGQTQEMSSDSVGNMLVSSVQKGSNQQLNQADRKPRPNPEQALKCPRCDSTNTKFCYYNNYSLTQPRYFCKACRRYWTKGGTLRNVPVGGGCRKNRRSSSSAAATPKRNPPEHHLIHGHPALAGSNFPLPPLLSAGGSGGCYDQNDLALAFARLQKGSAAGEPMGFDHLSGGHDAMVGSTGFLDALRTGFLDSTQTGSSAASALENLYYGLCGGAGNGDASETSTPTTVGVSSTGSGHNMGLGYDLHDHHRDQDQVTNATTTAVTVTTIKQELCNGNVNVNGNGNGNGNGYNVRDSDHQRNMMMWGCPWQLNGSDHHGNGSDFGSSWHGLLNTTPLM